MVFDFYLIKLLLKTNRDKNLFGFIKVKVNEKFDPLRPVLYMKTNEKL